MQDVDPYRYALETFVLSSATPAAVDRARVVIALRAARTPAERAAVLEVARTRRAEWLTYLTVLQRKWQGRTRRESRARHHDSVSIRERYVRCAS
jgi:hypothetical protein